MSIEDPQNDLERFYKRNFELNSEIQKSELEEYSRILENAKTPEERKSVLRTIISITRTDEMAGIWERELMGYKLSGVDHSHDSHLIDQIKEAQSMVNTQRQLLGLPPKYTE